MIKRLEMTDPQSCMSRAGEDEMTFVLLARDICAPDTIRDWVANRLGAGKNKFSDPQIQDALECAREMERQYAAMKR
jgi:hypothetical protein